MTVPNSSRNLATPSQPTRHENLDPREMTESKQSCTVHRGTSACKKMAPNNPL